jgi:hypothetical protein
MLGAVFSIFKRVWNAPMRKKWMLSKWAVHRAFPALASGCFDQGPTDMLRALSLAVLTAFALPTFATEAPAGNTVLAQSNPAPQQTPKRDCEKKQDEGVSA